MNAEIPLLYVSFLYCGTHLPCYLKYFCYTDSACEAEASARLANAAVWSVVASSSSEYFFCQSLLFSSSLPQYIVCEFFLFFALTS